MDFLKKNWAKIVLAALSLGGAILMMIPLFTAPEFKFFGACQILGIVLFFVGMVAYYILKMFDGLKLTRAIVLISTGVLVTTALCIGLGGFVTINSIADAIAAKPEGAMGSAYTLFSGSTLTATGKDLANATTAMNAILFTYLSLILVLGCFTLVKGVKKLICALCGCEKKVTA